MYVSIIFWILLLLIFYSYLGYAVIILLIIPFKKKRNREIYLEELPEITLVIASYNEEKILTATRSFLLSNPLDVCPKLFV